MLIYLLRPASPFFCYPIGISFLLNEGIMLSNIYGHRIKSNEEIFRPNRTVCLQQHVWKCAKSATVALIKMAKGSADRLIHSCELWLSWYWQAFWMDKIKRGRRDAKVLVDTEVHWILAQNSANGRWEPNQRTCENQQGSGRDSHWFRWKRFHVRCVAVSLCLGKKCAIRLSVKLNVSMASNRNASKAGAHIHLSFSGIK